MTRRQFVDVNAAPAATREYVAQLKAANPTYWTDEQILITLYAHRENHMAAIENALAPEWEAASQEVFADGNAGWSQIACTAIAMLRERAYDPDPTQAHDPHVDRLVDLIERSLSNGGCSNCGGTVHSTTCRVGRLQAAFIRAQAQE
jgi:hypothetical protein